MNIRKSYLWTLAGDTMKQKALALAILLKNRVSSSTIEHYSINQVAKIAGIAKDTAKKLVTIMLEEDFIHFEGNKENKILVVNCLSSSSKNNNINIDCFEFTTYKYILNSLQAFMFLWIVVKKKYVKHTLHSRHFPKNKTEFKAALKKVKNLFQNRSIESINAEYLENGLSYKRIAEVIGCSEKTAQKIEKYAEEKKWVYKIKRVEKIFSPKINFRVSDCFTFSSKNFLFIVHANAYKLSDTIISIFFPKNSLAA